jgi:hypothetical protein
MMSTCAWDLLKGAPNLTETRNGTGSTVGGAKTVGLLSRADVMDLMQGTRLFGQRAAI